MTRDHVARAGHPLHVRCSVVRNAEVSALPGIKHVVLLMLENRSFDNVLGWLYENERPNHHSPALKPGEPEYHGLSGKSLTNKVRWRNGVEETVPITKADKSKGLTLPLGLPGEEWMHVNRQVFGREFSPGKPPTQADTADMSGFLEDFHACCTAFSDMVKKLGQTPEDLRVRMKKHLGIDVGNFRLLEFNEGAEREYTLRMMQTYTPEQLSVLNGLARNFAVSDQWFASVPSQPNTNRAFSLCGTASGLVDNDNDNPFHTNTLFNVLFNCGDSNWAIYHHNPWPPNQHTQSCYTRYQFEALSRIPKVQEHLRPIGVFFEQARRGEPCRACPTWNPPGANPTGSSAMTITPPPAHLGAGEEFLKQVYEALSKNRDMWAETLLIVTFDEHGGLFDHVPPPWDTKRPDEVVDFGEKGHGFLFDRFGVRVPTLLVSPRIRPGTVFRSPTEVPYGHTSLLKTILAWRGIDVSGGVLGARAARAPSFSEVLETEVVQSEPVPIERWR